MMRITEKNRASTALLLLFLPLSSLVYGNGAAHGAIFSDRFTDPDLDDGIWTFIDPLGGAEVSISQGPDGNSRLAIDVPGGISHDPWGINLASRLMQDVTAEGDFALEARFDSAMTRAFQIQGIMVEQDDDSWLRFDFYHDGSAVRIFAARTSNGISTALLNRTVHRFPPFYMRVERRGNRWTQSYSNDGSSWSTSGEFIQDMVVHRVGVFAANHGWGSNVPAFTALIDHFVEVRSDEGPDEPPEAAVHLTTSVSGAGSVARNPDKPVYASGELVTLTARPAPGWTLAGWSGGVTGAANPLQVAMDRDLVVQADFVQEDGEADPEGVLVTEHFDDPDLDTGSWTFIDPLGGADAYITGHESGDGQLLIDVPEGTSHDPWGANLAPRLMRSVSDGDLAVEVKLVSEVERRYQIQGIMVEEDAGLWLRFDVYHDGHSTYLFAARTVDGSSTALVSRPIAGHAPLYLRVERAGAEWTQSYSGDGVDWTVAGVFSQDMIVNRVGVFAANHGIADRSPAFAAMFDDFVVRSEAGGQPPDEEPPDEEPPDEEPPDEEPPDEEPPDEEPPDEEPPDTGGPSIDLWYGRSQRFGLSGVSQRWVNVLGKVSSPIGVSSLHYSLNGGPLVPLELGPNGTRLEHDGDFNIDIRIDGLAIGTNRVVLTASDPLSRQRSETIDIHYHRATLPLPYAIDWNMVQEIQDVAHVVDGRWRIENGAVRTVEPGYDRLIAIGDTQWEDYEATVKVLVHRWTSGNYGSGVGLIMRWAGHYEWDGSQPAWGWNPLGALGWFKRYEVTALRIEDGATLSLTDASGFALDTGRWYVFKMQAVTNGSGTTYRLKVWPEGAAEPPDWHLVAAETFVDLRRGSLVLLAHNVDVSFGRVEITPLPREP